MVLGSIGLVVEDRVAAQSLVVADRSIVKIVHSLLVAGRILVVDLRGQPWPGGGCCIRFSF